MTDRGKPSRLTRGLAVALATGLALLGLALATSPAGAKSKPRPTPPSIPSCSGFSASAIARAIASAPLAFKGRLAHICTWQAAPPGHYRELVQIGVIPGIKSVFQKAEHDGAITAAKQHEEFGILGSRKQTWTAAFFVTKVRSNLGLPACKQGHTLPAFGPMCSSDPPSITANVYAYNSRMMVSAAAGAQQGDLHLSGVIYLVNQIMAGKIR
jgi:hypothetical protein